MTHAEERQRRQKIAESIQQGKSLEAVIRRFGVGLSTVSNACREMGVAFSYASPGRAKRNKRNAGIAADISNGQSVHEVARKHGLTNRYVRAICQQRAVTVSRQCWSGSIQRAFQIVSALRQNEHSQAEIGRRFKLSRERVRQIGELARANGLLPEEAKR